MATLFLKSTDVGAPTLNGVNGSLCNVLNWALVQNGWAVEYTATNARVYRAGSGNRRRLAVRHDSAVSGGADRAMVRGCENATSATAYTDPFPKVSQVANNASTWFTSVTADATARPWKIVLTPTFFILLVNIDPSVPDGYAMYFFGDLPPTDSADVWATIVTVNNIVVPTPELSYTPGWAVTAPGIYSAGDGRVYWCRSADGVNKSSMGHYSHSAASSGGYLSNCSQLPAARTGYGAKMNIEKLSASCIGGPTCVAAKASFRRGHIPNLWAGIHGGRAAIPPTVSGDTFTNTTYSGSAVFRVLDFYPYHDTYPWAVLEETDTWSPP